MTAAPQTLRGRLAGWVGQPVMILTAGPDAVTLSGTLTAVWADGVEVETRDGPAVAPWHAIQAAVPGSRWYL